MKLSGSESGDLKMERIARQEMVKTSLSPPPRRRAGWGIFGFVLCSADFNRHPLTSKSEFLFFLQVPGGI